MLSDGSSYIGGWEDGVPQGFGRLISVQGVSYKGNWNDGDWDGEGAMFGEGVWYRGQFHAGEPHGEGEGDLYRGQFRNGLHHGHGQFKVADGGVYDGEWRNGEESGSGKYIAPPNEYEGSWHEGRLLRGVWRREGKVHYEGDFISEEHAFFPHGVGKQLDAEGNVVFEGSFRTGKRAGHGTERLPDGVYTGEFDNNARSGKGTLRYPSGDVYDGEWRLGVRSGQGLFTFGNGKGYFKGQWDDDRPDGEGKRAWTRDGVVLEGEYHLGVALGKAIARWADGSHLTSEWRASTPNGQGSFVAANGWRLNGVWENGTFVEGSITHPDGRAVRGKVGHGWLPVLS